MENMGPCGGGGKRRKIHYMDGDLPIQSRLDPPQVLGMSM